MLLPLCKAWLGGGGVQKCYQYDSFLSPIKFAEDPTYFLGLFLGVHATETMLNRQPCGIAIWNTQTRHQNLIGVSKPRSHLPLRGMKREDPGNEVCVIGGWERE